MFLKLAGHFKCQQIWPETDYQLDFETQTVS